MHSFIRPFVRSVHPSVCHPIVTQSVLQVGPTDQPTNMCFARRQSYIIRRGSGPRPRPRRSSVTVCTNPHLSPHSARTLQKPVYWPPCSSSHHNNEPACAGREMNELSAPASTTDSTTELVAKRARQRAEAIGHGYPPR
jgi:hypothetical protein